MHTFFTDTCIPILPWLPFDICMQYEVTTTIEHCGSRQLLHTLHATNVSHDQIMRAD